MPSAAPVPIPTTLVTALVALPASFTALSPIPTLSKLSTLFVPEPARLPI